MSITKKGERVSDPATQYDKVDIRSATVSMALENEIETRVLGSMQRPIMDEVISTQLQEGMIIATDEDKAKARNNIEKKGKADRDLGE